MTHYVILCRRTGRRSLQRWPFMTLAVLAAIEAGLVEYEVVPVRAPALSPEGP